MSTSVTAKRRWLNQQWVQWWSQRALVWLRHQVPWYHQNRRIHRRRRGRATVHKLHKPWKGSQQTAQEVRSVYGRPESFTRALPWSDRIQDSVGSFSGISADVWRHQTVAINFDKMLKWWALAQGKREITKHADQSGPLKIRYEAAVPFDRVRWKKITFNWPIV